MCILCLAVSKVLSWSKKTEITPSQRRDRENGGGGNGGGGGGGEGACVMSVCICKPK